MMVEEGDVSSWKFKEYITQIMQTASKKRTWKKQRSMVEVCTKTACLTKAAQERGWKTFSPITIETGFDLLTECGRQLAWRRLMQDKPDVIVFEFMCDPWSLIQNVNIAKSEDFAQRLRTERIRHLAMLRWVGRVQQWQVRRHGQFLVENPSTSLVWKQFCLRRMQSDHYVTLADLCQFGWKDPETKLPYRKRTKLVSSSPFVDEVMSRVCPGDHCHQHLEGQTHYVDPDGIRHTINRIKILSCNLAWFRGTFFETRCRSV